MIGEKMLKIIKETFENILKGINMSLEEYFEEAEDRVKENQHQRKIKRKIQECVEKNVIETLSSEDLEEKVQKEVHNNVLDTLIRRYY
jgi:uncharacterized membrane-anchored protein YjiN (DUF445 family)